MFQSKIANVILFLVGVALESLAHVDHPTIKAWSLALANLGAALLLVTNVRRALPGKAE